MARAALCCNLFIKHHTCDKQRPSVIMGNWLSAPHCTNMRRLEHLNWSFILMNSTRYQPGLSKKLYPSACELQGSLRFAAAKKHQGSVMGIGRTDMYSLLTLVSQEKRLMDDKREDKGLRKKWKKKGPPNFRRALLSSCNSVCRDWKRELSVLHWAWHGSSIE